MPHPLQLLPPTVRSRVETAALRTALRLPRPLQRLVAGPPVRLDGQRLAPEAQVLLRLQHLRGVRGLAASTPQLARAAMRQGINVVDATPSDAVHTTPVRIPTDEGELAARLYRPHQLTEPSPLLVFYHGGGWVIGDLDTHDDLCRFLSARAEVRVLSVDYRLAPEHPFPAAVLDSLAAYAHVVEHAAELGALPDRIAVGGDSAGGNLAAVVAQRTTANGSTPPAFQLLIYPSVDATKRRRSRELFGTGFLLTDTDMDWFAQHYQPDLDQRADPRLSVLHADDLRGLPPAHVVTAGFDPLRDEGEAYAALLRTNGVPVVLRRFDDLIHGFATLRGVGGRFQEALVEIAATLRAGLALGDR